MKNSIVGNIRRLSLETKSVSHNDNINVENKPLNEEIKAELVKILDFSQGILFNHLVVSATKSI